MESPDHLIDELADLCGIVPEYWDIFGTRHETALATKTAILRAMGIDADDADAVGREIARRRNHPWNCLIEPVLVFPVNAEPLSVPVYLPVPAEAHGDLSLSWVAESEDGSKESGSLAGREWQIEEERWIDGVRHVKVLLPCLARRVMGYYTLRIEYALPDAGGSRRSVFRLSRLIVAPEQAFLPHSLITGKAWGLSLQLYGLRSRANWGAGDLADLADLVQWIASLGGDFVGINPLHALTNTMPYGVSPYSPVSRLYKNLIYLRLEQIPDVTTWPAMRQILNSPEVASPLRACRRARRTDYERAAALKRRILSLAFDEFCRRDYMKNTVRDLRFRAYMDREGTYLESFCTFQALSDHFSPPAGPAHWKEWPEPYRNPRSDEVKRFGIDHRKEVLFHAYVQWLIDEQVETVHDHAARLGMSLGIYHDLAFGSSSAGSDSWNYQDLIAEGVDVGAPPDDFNINGQNWGFPPLIPDRLREQGYDLFIRIIRNNMRHCGAIRIDHALGIFRLFWIPSGFSPAEGAYVKYPHEELLSIISLESVRNGTVVITEDLGTIGENVRDVLKRFRMLSYRLLYFERDYPSPSFTPPESYPPLSLASVTTHDLPTLLGFWTGRDIGAKKDLQIITDDAAMQRSLAERSRDRELLLSALRSSGIALGPGLKEAASPEEICRDLNLAVYGFLARAGSLLVSVSLDDILCVADQQNMPGIVDGFPCWRQKTPIALERMRSAESFRRLAEMFADAGRSNRAHPGR